MWFGSYGILPTDQTKKKLTLQRNNVEFQNVFNRLMNLSLNIFEWEGLPETCDQRLMEQALLWRGYMAFYRDKNGTIWSYSAGPGGKLTRYGYPSNGYLYALNGETAQCEFYWKFMDNTNANGVLCLDNKQGWAHINEIIRGAERIADARRALDTAANHMKIPFIFECTEEQKKSILSILNDVSSNEPVIITHKNNDFTDKTSMFTTGISEGVVKEMWDYYTNTYNDVLDKLGVQNNKNQDKKERMTIQEVSGSSDLVEQNIDYRLEERKAFCERVNEAFNLNVSVKYKHEQKEVINNNEFNEQEEKDNEFTTTAPSN